MFCSLASNIWLVTKSFKFMVALTKTYKAKNQLIYHLTRQVNENFSVISLFSYERKYLASNNL